MTTLIILALVASAGAGLAFGGYRLMTSPAVWAVVAGAVADALLPSLLGAIARKSPEDEVRDHAIERQAGNTSPKAHGHGGGHR